MPDINDLMPTTPDLNRERLDQLKRLMPDLFTAEGRLDPDELKRLVDAELVAESERFEFRWFGKANAKRRAFTPTTAALQYDPGRSVNPEVADGNMIIEGENLEVLKCLLAAYREKVKCIYIDPPYNTGNDFVYSDNYTEQRKAYWEQTGVTEEGVKVDTNSDSDGRYHSNWLNMMYPRLLLARQLLREDGVIFISIDDHEVHHLRKLCDEVFGEENFIAAVIWQKVYSPKSSASYFSEDHDYILIYSRNYDVWRPNLLPRTAEMEARYINPDNDPRGPWKPSDLSARNYYREGIYSITCPSGRVIEAPPGGRYWVISKEKFHQLDADNRIWWGEDGNNIPAIKRFLSEVKDGRVPQTLWKYQEVGHTQEAKKQLLDLVPLSESDSVFNTPKPTRLIQRILQLATTPDGEPDLVLDFFSGSGTTAQAVMEQNAADGGERKFILVQLPEQLPKPIKVDGGAPIKTIADLTIERNKRVIARIEQEQAEKQQQGLFEEGHKPYRPGFKVYRLVKSHFPRVEFQPDPEKTTEENIALFRQYIADKEATLYSLFNEADIFDEVMLKNGFQLHYTREVVPEFTANSVYRVTDGQKTALVCLDPELNDATVAALNGCEEIFICLERAVDTTKKWNLKHQLGEKLIAF
ncbi:MAG: hypothetical protein Tsb0017_09630 [Geothermobacteraceae bacterium]